MILKYYDHWSLFLLDNWYVFFFLQNNYSENREVEKNIEKRKKNRRWPVAAAAGSV